MRGRKPVPAAIKEAAGNPGRRPIPEHAEPVAGDPEPPPHLTAEAVAEWHRVTADMRAMGTLGREVRSVLAVYCLAWSRMVEAEAHVTKFGAIVTAPRTGVAMHNPHAAVAHRAANTVARLAAELGLTPGSRTRVGAVSPKPEADSPWDVFTVIDGGKKTPA
jgi:P27 family predicted phage terminase small subunit